MKLWKTDAIWCSSSLAKTRSLVHFIPHDILDWSQSCETIQTPSCSPQTIKSQRFSNTEQSQANFTFQSQIGSTYVMEILQATRMESGQSREIWASWISTCPVLVLSTYQVTKRIKDRWKLWVGLWRWRSFSSYNLNRQLTWADGLISCLFICVSFHSVIDKRNIYTFNYLSIYLILMIND